MYGYRCGGAATCLAKRGYVPAAKCLSKRGFGFVQARLCPSAALLLALGTPASKGDSLRMGERMAVGILLEQAPTYGDYVESTFTSFDGDHVILSGEGGSCPSLSIFDYSGNPVSPHDWWLRHVSGQGLTEDI